MTSSEQLQAHNAHRAKKIKMERNLVLALHYFLAHVLRQLIIAFKAGKILSASEFQKQMFDILKHQYVRVNKAVTWEYLDVSAPHPSLIDALASQVFNTATPSQVAIRTAYILATLQKDIDKAVTETQQSKKPNSTSVLAVAFRAIIAPRPQLIAITETQNAFEGKKHTLSTSFSQVVGRTLYKTWVTILDGKERPWHGDAFGQDVLSTALFTVMDEALMYPGDTTHGATPANICNCRCSALYHT